MRSIVQSRASLLILFLVLTVSCCLAASSSAVVAAQPGSSATKVHPAIFKKELAAATATGVDAAYVQDAAKLAAQAHATPPQQHDADLVTLADISVEHLLPGAQSVLHIQQVLYITSDNGARNNATRDVEYNPSSQRLTVIHARVFKANGRVVKAVADGESSASDAKEAMYYDTRSLALRFPSLQKGDVVDLEYRIAPTSAINPYGDYFGTLIAFQNDFPQQLHRYVLVAPSDRELNIAQERMAPMKVLMAHGKTTYIWDMRNLPPLADEPRGPSLTEVAPYVDISTFANWEQVGRWYANLIRPQFKLDAHLKEQLARLNKLAPTEIDKIHAIHEFVLRTTRYKAMEFGIYRYKPYPVSQVYEQHYGDCKDKASLMIALLRADDIDAELALIRTRKLGDVNDHATSLSVFDHAVAYIPKYDLWLDGTAEYAGFRELPLDDQGAMALTVNLNGQATLRRIPVSAPMDNYTHRVVRADVQPDGNIVFDGTAYTRGEDAPGLRRDYEIAGHQRDTLRANLAQVYPSVQVNSVHVKGANNLQHDVQVEFSGSLNTFKGKQTFALVPSWLPHRYVASLAPLPSRTEELELPAPWTTEEELHFKIPNNATLGQVPANWECNTQFGTASIRYAREGQVLVVKTSVQFRKLDISPSEYAGFRKFCQDVERAFHEEITVHLAS